MKRVATKEEAMNTPLRRYRGVQLGADEHVRLDPRPTQGQVHFAALRYHGEADGAFYYDSSNYDLSLVIRGHPVFSFSIIRCHARYACFAANVLPAQLREAIRTLHRLGLSRWVKPGLESLIATLQVQSRVDVGLLTLAQKLLAGLGNRTK